MAERSRSDETEEEGDTFESFIKVSANDEVVKLGAKIAWNARRGEHQPLLASGAAAINTAVEAIATARRFLGQDDAPSELLCQPAFRDEKKGTSLALYLSSGRFRKTDLEHSTAQFTVSKNSRAVVVAGAVAARAREGVGASMTAIGAEAVCNAVMAAAWARVYLDGDKLDLHLVVVTSKVEKTGGDGLRLSLLSTQLRAYVDELQ